MNNLNFSTTSPKCPIEDILLYYWVNLVYVTLFVLGIIFAQGMS